MKIFYLFMYIFPNLFFFPFKNIIGWMLLFPQVFLYLQNKINNNNNNKKALLLDLSLIEH